MDGEFTFRRAPSKAAPRLAAATLFYLVAAIVLSEEEYLIWSAWALAGVTMVWIFLPRPVSGIRIDRNHLVLSAWRKPRPIPLDSIDHLLTTQVSAETEVALVYKDGSMEGLFVGDLPDMAVFSSEMAMRGVPTRKTKPA